MGVMKKVLEKDYKYENQAFELALKKMDGARDDGWGVLYSKGGKRLIAAKKSIEGSYMVKDDTTEICDNAFWGCAFLRKVAIPASVERIGDEAFGRCLQLESVTIPASVEKLGKNPFVGLDSKVVDNLSPDFAIDSKILYTADHTRLISCMTDASMIIVPKSVKAIGSLAFTRRSRLKKVQLPEGLERIGRDAFSDCDMLEELTVPASVTTIDAYAFASCDALRKVTFLGLPTHLARTAFSDCDNLMSIIVPDNTQQKFRKMLHLTADSDTLVLGGEAK